MSQTKAQLINGKSATIEFTGGSASAPAVSFTGDTNTGIYSPGGDQVAISTNGTGRLFINSSGNVGVGTSSPSAKAHLLDSSSVALRIESSGANFVETNFVNTSAAYTIGIRPDTSNSLCIRDASASTTRVVLDTSGRLGIGTTSPSTILQCAGGASGVDTRITIGNNGASLQAGVDGSNFALIGTNQNQPFYFFTNGTERARIDTSGRLLVGTSTARSFSGFAATRFQVEGTTYGDASLSLTNNENTADGAYVLLGKSRGTTLGSATIVNNGDLLAGIRFAGADGSSLRGAADISAYVDGTPGASDMPGRLVFSTTADGASSPTERMRIHSNGYITYGTGSIDSTGLTFAPTRSGAGSAPTLTWNGSFTGTVTACDFLYNGARQGSITTTTSATAYNTSSDYRLKENIAFITDGITRLQQLKPSRFNFITDPTKTVDGFVAHEVQSVVPEAITGTKDEVDADGKPVYQGIDQSKLVPLLTAALQEAIGRIETLEAEVAALKAA